MTINVFDENVVSLTEAAKRLAKIRGGKRLAVSTLYRWAMGGLRARDGMVVQLETVRIGGTTCTSLEALQRFFERLGQGVEAADQGVVANVRDMKGRSSRCSDRREAELRAAERSLHMSGMDGDNHIFETFTGSKERLCDLHEFLHRWMPEPGGMSSKAFLAVRSGIFAEAALILAGKSQNGRGFDAAKNWISGLDLASMDVRMLPGVGATYATEWQELLSVPEVGRIIAAQQASGEPEEKELSP